MMHTLRSTRLALAIAVWLLVLRPASAQAPISDSAGFFSEAAVAKANETAREIKAAYDRDFRVETFKSAPPSVRDRFPDMSAAEKKKVFRAWAEARSKELKLKGVYVHISKQGGHLEVMVDPDTRKKAFVEADRDELAGFLLARFKEKAFDRGLTGAANFVRARIEKHLGPPAPKRVAAVTDEAQLFSKTAVEKAAAEIKMLRERLKMDLTIDLVKAAPANVRTQLEGATGPARDKVFTDWLAQRAGANPAAVNVLICLDPARVEIGVGTEAGKQAFRPSDREQLVKLLVADLKAKDYDKALSETADFVFDAVDRNTAPPVPAPAAGTVKDYANAFTAATRDKAAEMLRQVKESRKFDMTVETLPRVPAGKLREVLLMNPDAKTSYFRSWVKERAEKAGAQGIWILICKNPPQIQVSLGSAAAKDRFTPAEREALRDRLAAAFKENQHDRALTEAVAFVSDTLRAPAIRDNAGFFSSAAIEKGNAAVRDIRRRFHTDALVETFAEVPPERAQGVDLTDRAERRKVFAAWAEERQKAAGAEGINILICKNPMSLQVAVAKAATARFSTADRDQLVKLLINRFTDKNFDGGLADSLTFIGEALQKKRTIEVQNQPRNAGGFADLGKTPAKATLAKAPPTKDKDKGAIVVAQGKPIPPADGEKSKSSAVKTFLNKEVGGGFKMIYIVWILLGLLGLWIFVGMLRALFGRRPSYPPPQQQAPAYGGGPRPQMMQQAPQYGGGYAHPVAHPVGGPGPYYGQAPAPSGGGGGGFFSGLLGGMFGAAAGSWLYDRFARGSGQVSWNTGAPNPTSLPHAAGPAAGAAAGAGYTSSGGDFGDSPAAQQGYASSGGDFGEEPAKRTGYESSGGDFGEEPAKPAANQSAGGDFGEAADTRDTGTSGGDFGEAAETQQTGSGGGDFGGQEEQTTSDAGGGDFGSEPEQVADTGGGGDFGSTDAGGGDFGGSNVDTGGGGDFGGGGDAGGGGGGDFGGGDAG